MLWMLGRLHRYRISGPSMVPTLNEGDTVLVSPFRVDPSQGDIVLVRHPTTDQILCKRVQRHTDTGVFVVGDGSPSTDSRDFGAISADRIVGTVICTFP
jgi:nickel-type superoxide dismutase maturation protease